MIGPLRQGGEIMAQNSIQFQSVPEIKASASLSDIPMDVLAIGGAVLLVFVLVVLVVLRRLTRDDLPER